jgi:hypothetical protein
MPFVDYPSKDEAGYVTARRCHAPGGGWFVLYDRGKGGLPEMTLPIEETGRFVLLVRKSKIKGKTQWTSFDTRKEAIAVLKDCAAGLDEHGLIPVPSKAKFLTKPSPPTEATTEATEAPPSSVPDSPARVREASAVLPPTISDALAIQRALNEAFDPQRIVDLFEEGLKASKTFVTKEGEEIVAEDYTTRVKYLSLLTALRIGTPEKREKAVEPKRVTAHELNRMIQCSPAARRRLKKQIEEAEAAANWAKVEEGSES